MLFVSLHQSHHGAVPEFSRRSRLTKYFSREPVARRHLLPALWMSGWPIVNHGLGVVADEKGTETLILDSDSYI